MKTRLLIRDYLDKHGFGDGDSILCAVARRAAPAVIEVVNEALDEFKPEGVSSPTMVQFEISTLHNSICAEIRWFADGSACVWRGEKGFPWIEEALVAGQAELDYQTTCL